MLHRVGPDLVGPYRAKLFIEIWSVRGLVRVIVVALRRKWHGACSARTNVGGSGVVAFSADCRHQEAPEPPMSRGPNNSYTGPGYFDIGGQAIPVCATYSRPKTL
jgi:hypothetical protein